jgi:hypothetical protein
VPQVVKADSCDTRPMTRFSPETTRLRPTERMTAVISHDQPVLGIGVLRYVCRQTGHHNFAEGHHTHPCRRLRGPNFGRPFSTPTSWPRIGAHLLAGLGAMIGPRATYVAGRVSHRANLFIAVVGPTSRGGKGVAETEANQLLDRVDLGFRA